MKAKWMDGGQPVKHREGPGRDSAGALPRVGTRRGAVHRSAAPCSPTGFPRSTIGAARLSFRVRDGTGRAPRARTADRWAAPAAHPGYDLACPGGRTATETTDPRDPLIRPQRCDARMDASAPARWMRVRARAISTARLRRSRALHLRPIDQVVYLGPYRKEN